MNNSFMYLKGIFGKVDNCWYRLECQNRGAFHVHILFWLDKNCSKNDFVSAEMPKIHCLF